MRQPMVFASGRPGGRTAYALLFARSVVKPSVEAVQLGTEAERGVGTPQTLILLVMLALGAIGAVKQLTGRVDARTLCTGEAVVALAGGLAPCAEASTVPPPGTAPPPSAAPPATSELPIEGPDGPALEGAGPIIALPFPGTVAVSCTALEDQKETCKDQEGVRVQATGELSVERTPTKLDDKGCPQQSLSVSSKLQVELSGKAKGKTVGGTLSVFTGEVSKFKVTVSPDAADQIARHDRPPPNPVDPRSIRPGESVELSEEFYAGNKLQVTYRQLQVEMGFEQGRRLSSGVKRIDDRTVRVLVGDADFVRQALSLGVSVGSFGVSVGGKEELASGKLRSVDIDIGTQAGWDAYQEFLATGHLPTAGAPGIADPAVSESIDFSDATKLEARFGRVKLGGTLGDSEGHLTETRHADGTVERVGSARFNDVGLAVREKTNPDGTTETGYSLLIEGANRSLIESYEAFTGQSLHADPDGNVRLDFSESDLRRIQEQALDQVVKSAEHNRIEISREEIQRLMREDRLRADQLGLNSSFDRAFEIASADSPDEVLHQLYLLGGPGGNGSTAVDNLLSFVMGTASAHHGFRAVPRDHPDSLLPGSHPGPTCQ